MPRQDIVRQACLAIASHCLSVNQHPDTVQLRCPGLRHAQDRFFPTQLSESPRISILHVLVRAWRPITSPPFVVGPASSGSLSTQSSRRPGLTKHLCPYYCRNMTMNEASAAPLKGTAAAGLPIIRPSSPHPDPRHLGPKSQLLATRTSNYHSTSLRNSQWSSLRALQRGISS